MRVFLALLRKEWIQELRSCEVGVVMLSLSLLLSVLASVGVQLTFFSSEQVIRIAPLLLWLSFLFAATSALGRSFDFELQYGAIDGLRLSGVSPALVYLSKLIMSSVLLLITLILSAVVLLVLLDLQVPVAWPALAALSCMVVIAYGALATLFAAVAATSRLKGLILPLILFPLLFPLFLGAVETTNQILLDPAFTANSFWFSFTGLLTVLYLLLGINLYSFVIEE